MLCLNSSSIMKQCNVSLVAKNRNRRQADRLYHLYDHLVVEHTLFKIIKGTHVKNGISGIPHMLHFNHAVCQ